MGDQLLEPGDDPRLNACVTYGLDQWHVYAAGYRASAEIILDHVRETGSEQDHLIYPFVYVWRHHVELMLKGLGLQASKLLGAGWTPPGNHRLERLLDEVSGLLERVRAEYLDNLPQDMFRMTETVAAVATIDPKSLVFRYPEDLDGGTHLDGVTHINFGVVARHMEDISNRLEASQILLILIDEYRRDSLG